MQKSVMQFESNGEFVELGNSFMGGRDKGKLAILDLAEVVSQRCTCIARHYGAVIVKRNG